MTNDGLPEPPAVSMVYFMDEVIGNMTAILKRRNLWDQTLVSLVTFQSDNGGPSFEGGCRLLGRTRLELTPARKCRAFVMCSLSDLLSFSVPVGSHHTANNYPLRGSKVSCPSGCIRRLTT